jgi:hypothetical protein
VTAQSSRASPASMKGELTKEEEASEVVVAAGDNSARSARATRLQ